MTKNFYTAKEAQSRLGINENRFYYLVRTGKVTKVTMPGKKQGVYPRVQIDEMAASIKALIDQYARDTSVFEPATVDDLQEEFHIDLALFGNRGTTPLEARQARLEISPTEGNYVLRNTGKIVGHISFYPIEPETLEMLLSGNLQGAIPPDKILPFTPGIPLKIFIFILAVRAGLPADISKQYGSRLIAGAANALRQLGERGIEIVSIHATSRVPAGVKLCRRLGMEEKAVANEAGRFSYSLDIATSNSLLVEEYKEGLAAFKQENHKV